MALLQNKKQFKGIVIQVCNATQLKKFEEKEEVKSASEGSKPEINDQTGQIEHREIGIDQSRKQESEELNIGNSRL